ncbi:hypothetical protein EV182_001771 [Spiromyces aspiralis]|uniref:Uncharacterized protein n=1 Tax=Spiromyces aspiralis TaxID=68401 RepID=A0ACC1HSN4_9FUNG|nr:hypothetical protein EV182_001771 [Spiromyces aspiralis]
MYLWLQPKLFDQRSIRSELALKDSVACDHSMSLVDQIYQTVVELRQARKLPVGMILSVAAMTLADGQPALLLTLNKTVHHPLYILPGVSPKSAHPKPPHFSPSRKRGRSGSGNDDSEDVLSQALSARLDNWLDDWLLVQDRAQHRLTSDMVFIRRGSYSSACVPRPRDKNSADMAKNDPKAAKMARLGITVHTHHEATIQPTEQQARCLSKLNLDMKIATKAKAPSLDDSALMPSTIQGVDGGNLFSMMMMMGSTDNIFGTSSGKTDDLTLSLGGSEGGTIDPMLVGLDSTLDQINAQSEAVTSGASTESILAPSAASVPSAEQEEAVQPSSHSPPPPTVGGKWKPRGSAFTPCATKVHRSVSLGNQNIDSVMTSAPHDVTLSAPPARRIKSLNFANLASPPQQQQQQQHLFEDNLPMLSSNIGGIGVDKLAACIDAHHSTHQAHPSSIMPSFMNFDPFSNLQGTNFAQKVPGGGNGGGWPSDQWFLRFNPFDAAAAPTTTTSDCPSLSDVNSDNPGWPSGRPLEVDLVMPDRATLYFSL